MAEAFVAPEVYSGKSADADLIALARVFLKFQNAVNLMSEIVPGVFDLYPVLDDVLHGLAVRASRISPVTLEGCCAKLAMSYTEDFAALPSDLPVYDLLAAQAASSCYNHLMKG